MKFGPIPLAEAEGAILAHSLRLPERGRLAKGSVLTADAIATLQDAGHSEVIAAVLEPGDIEENAAAQALADAILTESSGLRASGAGAGRVNLYATGPGILALDVARIDGMNAVHPMITLATLPQYQRVEAGQMVATIKIIAYAVPEDALKEVCADARATLELRPPVYGMATLIETRVGNETPSRKGRAALAERLDRLGLGLTDRVVVGHVETPLAEAISDAAGEFVFVLTASATSDPHDVAPEALRRAGGTVTAYGMPVDPGNLLFFGSLGEKPVIGLPGCARSPAMNGADWVLERLICGVELDQKDISAMGVGGLLKEIPTRPRPRGGDTHPGD